MSSALTTSTETIYVPGAANPLQFYTARPPGKKSPVVFVLMSAFGVNEHIRDIARRVAAEGYFAIAPDLFSRTAPPGFHAEYGRFDIVSPHMNQVAPEHVNADLGALLKWAGSQPEADPGRAASIGFCLGGTSSFVANATLPLRAAVSFYGGGIAKKLLHLAPQQHGPILFFWGGQDQHIGVTGPREITDALLAAKRPFVDVIVSEGLHSFFTDDWPERHHPAGSAQAWALTRTFLASNLKEA